MDELISHYGDVKSNTFFSPLINLRQKGPITEYIQQFQKLSLRVKNIPEDNLLDLFLGTLKENIQHVVRLLKPKSLEQGKWKTKIWLLEGWPPTTIKSTMFPLLTSLNRQGLHLNKWMKEEKRDYVSIVTTSTLRGINAMRRNYST
jgi:hypothetical protein